MISYFQFTFFSLFCSCHSWALFCSSLFSLLVWETYEPFVFRYDMNIKIYKLRKYEHRRSDIQALIAPKKWRNATLSCNFDDSVLVRGREMRARKLNLTFKWEKNEDVFVQQECAVFVLSLRITSSFSQYLSLSRSFIFLSVPLRCQIGN